MNSEVFVFLTVKEALSAVFMNVYDLIGGSLLFIYFFVPGILALAFLYLTLPETSHRNTVDVVDELKRDRFIMLRRMSAN